MERTISASSLADILATKFINNDVSLFIAIGGETAWDDDLIPPIDTFSTNAEKEFRDGVWGLKQIEADEFCLVCPRINWQTNTAYAAWDPTDPNLYLKNFYVLADENKVFKCVESGADLSTEKPALVTPSPQTLGDGYTWQFLYELSVYQASTFLTDNWLPIPSRRMNNQQASQTNVENNTVWVADSPMVGISGGHGSYAAYELPCRHLMVSAKVSGLEGGAIANGRQYRQVGFWVDPRLTSTDQKFNLRDYGSNNAMQILASGRTPSVTISDLSSKTIERYSGEIIYLENRQPVTKSLEQDEIYRLVIRF